jgi:hypothetical protein
MARALVLVTVAVLMVKPSCGGDADTLQLAAGDRQRRRLRRQIA